METSKIITIEDPQSGRIKEEILQPSMRTEMVDYEKAELQALGLGKYASLKEAATTSEFPTLLLSGLKQILFDSYDTVPTTYEQLVQQIPSDKPAEDWLELNRFGTLPVIPEATEYPKISAAVDRAVRIANSKRGAIFEITREMIKFDKTNQMRQFPTELGSAAKRTIEANVYSVLTTAGNYVRNSTTGDNNIGANTAATTFSAGGLEIAYSTLTTMKDRKSGTYLGINPTMLLVTPRLEWSAKQLLLSPDLRRAGTGNTSPGQEVYGTGGANPFRGAITQIVVSPWVGTQYEWILMEPKKAIVLQIVEPLNLLVEDVRGVQNEAYFLYDVIRYRVDIWYGVGMVNDRFAYFSSSTSAPTVA